MQRLRQQPPAAASGVACYVACACCRIDMGPLSASDRRAHVAACSPAGSAGSGEAGAGVAAGAAFEKAMVEAESLPEAADGPEAAEAALEEALQL